jgi:putative endonuclease
MHERYYYTYIMASRSLTLYIGMTGDLDKRIFEHKDKLFEGFSADYNCDRLVWFERYAHASSAIAREKQQKGWIRAKSSHWSRRAIPRWSI